MFSYLFANGSMRTIRTFSSLVEHSVRIRNLLKAATA